MRVVHVDTIYVFSHPQDYARVVETVQKLCPELKEHPTGKWLNAQEFPYIDLEDHDMIILQNDFSVDGGMLLNYLHSRNAPRPVMECVDFEAIYLYLKGRTRADVADLDETQKQPRLRYTRFSSLR